MAKEAKELVNVPVFGEDSIFFGGVSIEALSDERIAGLVEFWGIKASEGQEDREALVEFCKGLTNSLEGDDATQTLELVRKAIVLEAELDKPLEKYRNKELQNFLNLAGIEYETDANKKTLCDLLRFGPLDRGNDSDLDDVDETSVDEKAPEQTSETEDPKMVSVFSHYEAAGRIKDNGKSYNIGDEYVGENVDSLLASGALRAVYVEKHEDEIPDGSDS